MEEKRKLEAIQTWEKTLKKVEDVKEKIKNDKVIIFLRSILFF